MEVSQTNIQSTFLEQVRKQLPPNLSLVDELAEILNISRDSVYRRIRGETVLSLDEAKIICNRYGVSLDALLSTSSEMVSFQVRVLDAKSFSFDKYLKSLLGNLEMINKFQEKELIWYAKDLPIWHYFQFPRLSAFKLYFWDKTFIEGSKLRAEKYNRDLVTKELLTLAEQVWEKYTLVPSTEILNYENLNATLRQIEYAYECGLFSTRDEALRLCDDCCVLMNHIREQAEQGIKKIYSKEGGGGKFDLYINEVLIGDNSVLFKMDDKRVVFITANQFSILTTTQESFCKMTENYMNNMINKSVLISHTSERERSKFFNRMDKMIQDVKERLK